jgi:hypothetical protein
MTTRRTKLLTSALVLTAAAAAGAALLPGGGPAVSAQEKPKLEADEPVRDRVEKLLTEAMSDDLRVRERAEKEIVALGDPARVELDRLTRDPDPKKAIAALKLLQSDAWERRERRAARDEDERGHGVPVPDIDLRRFQDEIDRQMEDLRRRMQEWEKGFDIRSWVPEFESRDGAASGGSSSGTVIENDRSFSWTIDGTGKVKVQVKDGRDAPEKVYEAPSIEELRKQSPDIASRLEGYAPQGGARRWVFRWPRTPWQERDARPAPGAPGAPDDRPGARPPLRDGEERLAPHDGDDPLAPQDRAMTAPGPLLGIGSAAVPDVLREQLDLGEGGMVVESVLPNSLAAKLGLRRNDVLLKVGDRAVAGPPDVRKALEAVPEGAAVKVEIVRKGRRETLSATR